MHPRRLNLYIQPLFLLSEALSLHSKMISMNYFGQVVYEMEKNYIFKKQFWKFRNERFSCHFLIFHKKWGKFNPEHSMLFELYVYLLLLRTINIRKKKWNCFEISSLSRIFIQACCEILPIMLKKCPVAPNAILTIYNLSDLWKLFLNG